MGRRDATRDSNQMEGYASREEAGMARLRADCISTILSLTSPADALRLAAVSKTFREAAESDLVWERWLPPDYREILNRAVEPMTFLSKKALFRRLSTEPVLIDGGTKSFGLEKSTGKKCYMLSARDITIIWSHEPRYWQWVSLPPRESRFPEVAELLGVCWLEIRGTVKTAELSPLSRYSAFLVFRLTTESYGFDGILHEARLSVGVFPPSYFPVYLQPPNSQYQTPAATAMVPQARTDGWMEIGLGEFSVDEEEIVGMGVYETKHLWWKGGLIVQGIELRPTPSLSQDHSN